MLFNTNYNYEIVHKCDFIFFPRR